jgi:hypothetical protein
MLSYRTWFSVGQRTKAIGEESLNRACGHTREARKEQGVMGTLELPTPYLNHSLLPPYLADASH